jgi:hypothetical protein
VAENPRNQDDGKIQASLQKTGLRFDLDFFERVGAQVKRDGKSSCRYMKFPYWRLFVSNLVRDWVIGRKCGFVRVQTGSIAFSICSALNMQYCRKIVKIFFELTGAGGSFTE